MDATRYRGITSANLSRQMSLQAFCRKVYLTLPGKQEFEMPRDIPVGNGKLLITFDQDYCLRDIYYPCVGKENHTDGHRFRFGVWVDGRFAWVKRENWDLSLW